MRFSKMLSATLALFNVCMSGVGHAADCDANFSYSGNFLTGQSFKTFSDLPTVSSDSAFAAVQRHLAAQGWAIQHADRTAGVLTAWHAGSRPERPIPLSVTVEQTQGGSKLSLSFSTPGASFAPADSIKQEFCKMAAAALAAPAAPATPDVLASAQPGRASPTAGAPQAAARVAGAPGQLCLGKACLGMTLEEAAALPLDDVGFAKFETFDNGKCLICGSAYGLDVKGRRRFYAIHSLVDAKWIRQYSQAIKLACVVGSTSAYTKASDGQRIILSFAPAMRNGKGVMELVNITRFLPKGTMSESQWKAFEQQAQERYGAAFFPQRGLLESPRGAYVTVHPDHLAIRGVRSEENVNKLLKEQPGCSEPTSLE